MHNLTAILADPGAAAAGFAPQALDYTLSGMPVGAHSLLLEIFTDKGVGTEVVP